MNKKRVLLFLIPIAALALLFLFPKNVKDSFKNNQQKSAVSEPETTTPPPSTILIAVGDIMLSRHVGEKIRVQNNPKAPFLKTAGILSKVDISFCNLESPFYDQGPPVTDGMVFKAEPNTIEGLKYAGFDIVSLANNHFGDRGTSGMNFTFKHLLNNGIFYVGSGSNNIAARAIKIIERNGIKFAFLGYADASSMTPESYKATPTKPGVAWLIEENVKQDIKNAKLKADVVIVSFHWGTEYQQIPSERQKNVGRLAIDSGATLVLGHHPHVLQPYEKYKEGYIFYSLGNFVFDQMWSVKTRKGEIAKIYFKATQIEKVEIIPTTIYDYYQPKVD